MSRMSEELDAARVMKIIDHPVRVRIIELLATKGPLSWKELSTEVGTRTGALYHHLDALEQIVTKDPSKRYALTRLGEDVHRYLSQDPSSRSPEGLSKTLRQRSPLGTLAGFFIPRSLVYYITSSRVRSVYSTVILASVALTLVLLSDSQVTLFSFTPSGSRVLSAGTFLGSLAAISAFSYVSLRALRERADLLVLLASSALSFLPLADFSLLVRSLASLGMEGVLAQRTVLTVALAFFQAWGAGIVGAGMSVASGVRIEKTLLLSLALLYVTMVIVFLQGGRLS